MYLDLHVSSFPTPFYPGCLTSLYFILTVINSFVIAEQRMINMLPWQQWSILIINRPISCLGEMLWLRADTRHYVIRALAYWSKSSVGSHEAQPYSCTVLLSDAMQQWLTSPEDLTYIAFDSLKGGWYLRNHRVMFLHATFAGINSGLHKCKKLQEKTVCHISNFI